ncbi:MAG TPA: TonB-dependent receptor, partial [Rubricoccaceae bacterium]
MPALAQSPVIGTVVDADGGEGLPGVNVLAVRLDADSLRSRAVTGLDGTYRLDLPDGQYRIVFSFVSYTPVVRTATVQGTSVSLPVVTLGSDPEALGEAVVEAVQERVRLRGDTTVYNAGAFQVAPDATAEDLIGKLPGVVVEDGTVTAQGETVQRVLVDGEEFLGDDPTAALRNLPAEVIQEIEVFDRQSDQARFTGFDDGQAQRTINIVTRPDRRNGQFGRVFGGYGPDNRYLTGAAVNVFDGARRITLIGLANNVNQQNFSSDDLLGVLSAAGGGQRGGRGGAGGRGGGRSGGGPPGGGGRGGGDAGSYLIGEQTGINATTALGVNYIDRWGPSVRATGSYFFNRSANDTEARLDREYLLAAGSGQVYSETSTAEGRNANHRLNARIEATLSEATALTFTPRLSIQGNAADHTAEALSALTGGAPLSQSTTAYTSETLGYTSTATALLRHRFATPGRTVSVSLTGGLDGRGGDTDQDVQSLFYDATGLAADSTDVFRRQIASDSRGRQASASVAYTEPLGTRGQFQVRYAPSASWSASDQDALRLDAATGAFTTPDPAFTALSDQRVVAHRGGAELQYRGEGVRASVGVDLQNEQLTYSQDGPRAFSVDRSTFSVLPSAQLRIDLSEAANLDLTARTQTRAPSVSELRDVVDATNPLLVTAGNPDLRTGTQYGLNARFRASLSGGAEVFVASANVTTTRDFVGTSTLVAGADTVLTQGVTLVPGAQLTVPVNLDGYWNARTSVTYGRPIAALRSNANVTAGAAYTRTPGLIGGVLDQSDAVQLDGRLSLSSNISERLDFTLSYGLSSTTVSNSSGLGQDGDYLRHRAGARLNARPAG